MRSFRYPVVILGAMLLLQGCQVAGQDQAKVSPAHFTLWQLPSQTGSQINSYVLQTSGQKVIVIDGGVAGEALGVAFEPE